MSDARTCPNCRRPEGHHDQPNAFADAAYCWASYGDEGPAELECMRVRAERAERERDKTLEMLAVAREQRDRVTEELARTEAARGVAERERDEERARREEVERERDGAMEEARRAREATGEEHRKRLAEEAQHRKTERQAAAMREALNLANDFTFPEVRRGPAADGWVSMREKLKVALSGDAGRGALLPTGTPGRVAVKVADGLAWLAVTTVYAMHRHAALGAWLVTGTISEFEALGDDATLVIGGEEQSASSVYLDRSRCIRNAVLALTAELQLEIAKRLPAGGVSSAARNADDAVEQHLTGADPDALLRAYQEVCR